MALSIIKYFKKLSLAVWLGTQAFFIIGVAPSVFKVLDRPVAAKLMAEVFPRYFLLGSVCGGIFLVLLLTENAWVRRQGLMVRFKFIPLVFTLIATASFAYCYFVLLPQILEAQSALFLPQESGLTAATSSTQFQELHSLSTKLNGLALLSILVLLFFV